MNKSRRFSVRDVEVTDEEARRYIAARIEAKEAEIEDLRKEIEDLRRRDLPKALPKYVESEDGEWELVTHMNPMVIKVKA